MAQAAFVLIAVFASVFFARRRKLDPLSVAFGSSLIYFIPGFFGVATFSYGQGLQDYSETFVPGAYAVMSIVLASLVAGSVAIDRVTVPSITRRVDFQCMIPAVLFGFTALATVISIRHTGRYFLCLDKSITLDQIDIWYNAASIAAAFLVATAYASRQRLFSLAGCLFIVADMYAGFRLSTAIALLSVVTLSGDRLFKSKRSALMFIAATVLAGASLFVVKHLIVPAKYATASYCPVPTTTTKEYLSQTAKNLMWSHFYFSAFVSQSEPFVIQSTLNEVIRKDFRTGSGYLQGQMLAGIPLSSSIFGIDTGSVTTFNSRAQHVLFPGVSFGMANTPWGQAYAAGGFPMVIAFAVGYAAILGLLTALFNVTDGALRGGIAVIGVWVGFYFHRNDLFIEILYVKDAIYIFVLSLLIAWGGYRAKCRWYPTSSLPDSAPIP